LIRKSGYVSLGLPAHINLLTCENLTLDTIFRNCDINAVGIVIQFHVTHSRISNLTIQSHPAFWQFLLKDNILRPIGGISPAQTVIRLAFKSKQLNLSCDFGSLDPCEGEVRYSQKKKFETLRGWKENPLAKYKLKATKNKLFVLVHG